MQLPYFIARRYAFSRHSLNFITIITSVSIVGIAIGVAALIVVTSIFNGFRTLAESGLIGFDPHVRVSAANGAFINAADSLHRLIRAVDGVRASSSVLSGKVIGAKGAELQALQLNGVDPQEIDMVSGVSDNVISGEFDIGRHNGVARLVLGIGVADKLGTFTGDSLMLISPAALEESIVYSSYPQTVKAVVAGVFQLNNREYDAFYAYSSRGVAARLFRAAPNTAMSIDIRGAGVEDADGIAKELRALLGDAFLVETWYDLHEDLYNVLRFERMAAFTIFAIIILIAVFNVFASLTMTVKEKRSEIGVLKAMGASSKLIVRIFFGESVLIGVTGTSAGLVLGLLLCYGQIHYRWFTLDTSKYIVPAIPLEVHGSDIITIAIVALVLALLAGIYPARKAAAVRMARALMIERGMS